jgi:glucose-6-phosphate dehydrogenase assembly protein OpcA
VSRPSEPALIDGHLAALWRELAREGPVTRTVLSNLVVFCERSADGSADPAGSLGERLEEVARRHPTRLIALHDIGNLRPSEPIAAEIALLTFGPPHARTGVEQIFVRSACAEASLPSIVRRLTLGDLPISVWWMEDMSRVAPLAALITMGRQLVFDSRRWRDARRGVLALGQLLQHPHAPAFADLNWRRLAPLRQALLHAVESPTHGNLHGVRVRHRAGEAPLAWLLVGWLEARLTSGSPSHVQVEEGLDDDRLLSVSLEPAVPVVATLTAAAATVEAAAPIVIAAPQEREADAVAAELRALSPDVCLHEALAALTRRFTAA